MSVEYNLNFIKDRYTETLNFKTVFGKVVANEYNYKY